MSHIAAFISLVRRDGTGQGLAEYALILALIAIVAIVALIFLGGQIGSILSEVSKSMWGAPSLSRRSRPSARGGSASPRATRGARRDR